MSIDYLIDTSVWIDYFRDLDKELNDRIDTFIEENSIYINGVVLTELLLGARNEKDFQSMASTLAGLNFIQASRKAFEEAGRNGFILKRSGITIPLSDLLITSDCIINNLVLIDRDQHFKKVAKILKLKRFFD